MNVTMQLIEGENERVNECVSVCVKERARERRTSSIMFLLPSKNHPEGAVSKVSHILKQKQSDGL